MLLRGSETMHDRWSGEMLQAFADLRGQLMEQRYRARPDLDLRADLQRLAQNLSHDQGPSPIPEIEQKRQVVRDLLERASRDLRQVRVEDVDQVIRMNYETAAWRRRRGLGDPLAAERSSSIEILGRLRRHLLEMGSEAAV